MPRATPSGSSINASRLAKINKPRHAFEFPCIANPPAIPSTPQTKESTIATTYQTLKGADQGVRVGHSSKQRSEHHRGCRSKEYHRHTGTNPENSISNPASSKWLHNLIRGRKQLRQERREKEERRPSPEIPLIRDFPSLLFSPARAKGEPHAQAENGRITFAGLLGVSCIYFFAFL